MPMPLQQCMKEYEARENIGLADGALEHTDNSAKPSEDRLAICK